MAEQQVSASRADQAYFQLLEKIKSGELAPGSRIKEQMLAEGLAISRTPVREAIRRLQSEGLVVAGEHQGLAVAQLDYQAVMELYQMRAVLEGTAAQLAAQHASDVEISALKKLLESEEAHRGDIKTQAKFNRAFHHGLYQAAHNRYLLKSLNGLSNALMLLGSTTYEVSGRMEQALEEHRVLLSAIENRDGQGAWQAATKHIASAQQARIWQLNVGIEPEGQ